MSRFAAIADLDTDDLDPENEMQIDGCGREKSSTRIEEERKLSYETRERRGKEGTQNSKAREGEC